MSGLLEMTNGVIMVFSLEGTPTASKVMTTDHEEAKRLTHEALAEAGYKCDSPMHVWTSHDTPGAVVALFIADKAEVAP